MSRSGQLHLGAFVRSASFHGDAERLDDFADHVIPELKRRDRSDAIMKSRRCASILACLDPKTGASGSPSSGVAL